MKPPSIPVLKVPVLLASKITGLEIDTLSSVRSVELLKLRVPEPKVVFDPICRVPSCRIVPPL